MLSSFSCPKDIDIEKFIKERAIEFEKLGKSRTYLIFIEECFNVGKPIICGYFSLSLKSLQIPEKTSNRTRMKLDGFSSKKNNEPIKELTCYLIGQLSKNFAEELKDFSGSELLDYAFEKISHAQRYVGGRFVLVECHNDKKIINFYKNNGFEHFANIPDNGKEMLQFISKIS